MPPATSIDVNRLLGLCDALDSKVGLSASTRRLVRRARRAARRPTVGRSELGEYNRMLLAAIEAEQEGARRPVLSIVAGTLLALIPALAGIVGILGWLGVGPAGLMSLVRDVDLRAMSTVIFLLSFATVLICFSRARVA
jgi:hypothetical protein